MFIIKREARIEEAIKTWDKLQNKEYKQKTDEEIVKLIRDGEFSKEANRVFIQKLDSLPCFEEFSKNFKGFSKKSDKYYYVWISLTSEDIVIVVGRSSFNKQEEV